MFLWCILKDKSPTSLLSVRLVNVVDGLSLGRKVAGFSPAQCRVKSKSVRNSQELCGSLRNSVELSGTLWNSKHGASDLQKNLG